MDPRSNLTFTFTTTDEDSLDDHDTGLEDFDVTLRIHDNDSVTPDTERTGSGIGPGDIPHIAVTPMTPPSGEISPDGHSTVSLNSSNGGSPLFRPRDFGAGNQLINGVHTSVNRNLWRSESPLPPQSETEAKDFFAYRDSIMTHVVTEVQKTIDVSADGIVRGTWLLTEIDSWNHEWERIIILCEKVMFIIKYDFIGMKIEETRRQDLSIIDKVIQGELVYPQNSWTP